MKRLVEEGPFPALADRHAQGPAALGTHVGLAYDPGNALVLPSSGAASVNCIGPTVEGGPTTIDADRS